MSEPQNLERDRQVLAVGDHDHVVPPAGRV
jgi:hypothetical protein